MARKYAGVVGVVVILIGVVGLLAGEELLLGLVNIDIVEDLVHLLTGGLLAYVGFGQRDEGLARGVVGGLGVVYLLVGVLGFVVPMLLGLLPHGYSIVDNIIHLTLGVAGIAVAFASRGGAAARA
ncbi:MAG: hypothetical protein M3R38_05415 [Actinomycetota bacterium]|nr:hypothetical protein [Actinomycetota bacterium]